MVLHHLNDIAPPKKNSRECGFGDCCFFNAAERRMMGCMGCGEGWTARRLTEGDERRDQEFWDRQSLLC